MLMAIASMLIVPISSMPNAQATMTNCVDITLDFSQFSHGDMEDKIDGELAPLGILIVVEPFTGNPPGEGFDKPQIFDTSQTNTADPDLEVIAALSALNSDYQNVLIIPENNGVNPPTQPDDAADGGEVIFNFLWKRNVGKLVFVDADRDNGKTITAYDGSGGIIKTVGIPDAGDGSVQEIDVDAEGVKKLVVSYADSGAIGPIELPCFERTNNNCEDTSSETVGLTVNSIDLLGDTLTGLFSQVDCGGDSPIITGFTTLEDVLHSGNMYRVCSADFEIFVFSSWLNNGSQYSCILIIPTGNTILTAIYDTGRPAPDPNALQVSLVVNAIDEANDEDIPGLWTAITTYGLFVGNGFTELDQLVSSGVLYTVCMGEWPGYLFVDWSDGDTNICKNVSGGSSLPDARFATI